MRATFYKGKYVKYSLTDPRPIARCDYSGMMCMYESLVNQPEYNATGLYQTGYKVNPKFLRKPNPHKMMPPVRIDPEPVMMGRPGPLAIVNEVDLTTITLTGDITLTSEQFYYNNFIFQGALTGLTTIFVPALFNQFRVLNSTTGGFELVMEIENLSNTAISLPPNQTLVLVNNGFSLTSISLDS